MKVPQAGESVPGATWSKRSDLENAGISVFRKEMETQESSNQVPNWIRLLGNKRVESRSVDGRRAVEAHCAGAGDLANDLFKEHRAAHSCRKIRGHPGSPFSVAVLSMTAFSRHGWQLWKQN